MSDERPNCARCGLPFHKDEGHHIVDEKTLYHPHCFNLRTMRPYPGTDPRPDKNAYNRASSAQILEDLAIDHEIKNMGLHIIVKHSGLVVDFWPGTGKWIVRGNPKKKPIGRGIFPLLRRLGYRTEEFESKRREAKS